MRTRLRPLKVATRVRIPLGVLTVEPQVAARFVPLSWGFLVSDDHLVVSGSCHASPLVRGLAGSLTTDSRVSAVAVAVVDEEPADAAARWAVRGPVRSGRRLPGPWCRYSTANAVGAGSFTWRGRHSPCRAGLGRW